VIRAFCLLLTAHCLLPPCTSVFVIIIVIVERFLFDDVQFYGIKAHDFQLDSTLFTFNHLPLIRIGIDVDIGITFGTRSGRHFFYLQ
jgi:hypothetical protein